MSENVEGTMRRMRRIVVIAGLVAALGVLGGCSAGDSSSMDAGNPADAAMMQEAAPEVAGDTDGVSTQARTGERAVITTGYLYVTVEDPIAAADQAASIVQGAGGRIDARSESAPEENFGGSATLTLRVPSDELDAVVDRLRTLGSVDQFTTQSQDVTTQVTDLDARITALRASTDRVLALMEEATNITDIIALEGELSSRQAELESLEAQQRGLADQVSMSTIDLSLTTEPVVIVDDSPHSFLDGLVAGWHGLVSFVSVALVVFGVLLPWLLLIGLLVAAVVVPIKITKSRAARRLEGRTQEP